MLQKRSAYKGTFHSKLECRRLLLNPDLDRGPGDIFQDPRDYFEFDGGKEFFPMEVCCGRGLEKS